MGKEITPFNSKLKNMKLIISANILRNIFLLPTFPTNIVVHSAFFFFFYCFLYKLYHENLMSKFNHFQDYLDSLQDYRFNALTRGVNLSKILHLGDESDLFTLSVKTHEEFLIIFKGRKMAYSPCFHFSQA